MKLMQQEVTEFSKKLTILEAERQKSLEDMAWAQNYCFGMEKKIKQLEKELSKYTPVLLDLPEADDDLELLEKKDIKIIFTPEHGILENKKLI